MTSIYHHPLLLVLPPLRGDSNSLSVPDKKVVAVAIASIAFLVVQMGISLTVALPFSFAVTVLTSFCLNEGSDWFNLNFDWKTTGYIIGFLFLRPLISVAVHLIFGWPFAGVAQEGVEQLILSSPLSMMAMAGVIAPFTEEVLFRGVLMESLENLGCGETLSNLLQAGLFGAVHLNQKIQEGMQIPIFLLLSAMGYFFAVQKRENGSLLSPIAIHSANNFSSCGFILLRPWIQSLLN